jgi:hypothetical protein
MASALRTRLTNVNGCDYDDLPLLRGHVLGWLFEPAGGFYAQINLPLFWDGDVPQSVNPREQSQLPRSRNAPMASQNLDDDLSILTVDVMLLYTDMIEMAR